MAYCLITDDVAWQTQVERNNCSLPNLGQGIQKLSSSDDFSLHPTGRKMGSAQESVKVFILRGFQETGILVSLSPQRRHLLQNGRNDGFAVEMTLRGTYGGIVAEGLLFVSVRPTAF